MNSNQAGLLQPAHDAAGTQPTTPLAIVVFALDAALATRLSDALPRITIHVADTVADLADLLVAQPCSALGVEVAALGAGASELLARLAGLFPDLPVVALGSPHDAPVVAPLLASGEVHAFLARPIVAGAAREAFESAFRRNAALARSSALRRAAALRRSSTFLVRESRVAEDTAREVGDARATLGTHTHTLRLPLAGKIVGRFAAFALLAAGALGAAAWLVPWRGPQEAPTASSAAPTTPRANLPPLASAATDVDTMVRSALLLSAAEQALADGRVDAADGQARQAAALASTDPGLAARLATVLDGVATERRALERTTLARARWARAAREWERMRAEEAAAGDGVADAAGSRTREATSPEPSPVAPDRDD